MSYQIAANGLGRFSTTAINAAHLAGLLPAWRRFVYAAREPETVQLKRLRETLRRNASTSFGRAHRFSDIESLNDFQHTIPYGDFESFRPWIDRIAAGEHRVLTASPVIMLERTSSSLAENKLIPFTREFLTELSGATGPWIFDLYSNHPSLVATRSYWSVSRAARGKEYTSGGLPIGFEDDTEYFGPVLRWAIRKALAVSPKVKQSPTIEEWRTSTCRSLLAASDLGLMSIWSPTFLTRLMESIENSTDDLTTGLPRQRAQDVKEAVAAGTVGLGERLWPELVLISCWTDGSSQAFLPSLRRFFPNTEIQSKGLFATEGVVSFPLGSVSGSVVAVTSHFLEFIDLDHPQKNPLLAHELRVGGSYSPLLTTSGGLYRYGLGDAIECVGRLAQTPLIRFLRRLDATCDLCGEKVDSQQVDAAVMNTSDESDIDFRFALLDPRAVQKRRRSLQYTAE